MTVENMRQFIVAAYAHNAIWQQRVYRMPDNQVIAIYHRLLAAGKTPSKPVPPQPKEPCEHTIYECLDCKAVFSADNPQLFECRYCGSSNIITT